MGLAGFVVLVCGFVLAIPSIVQLWQGMRRRRSSDTSIQYRFESAEPVGTASLEVRWAIYHLKELGFHSFTRVAIQLTPKALREPFYQYMAVDPTGHVLAAILHIGENIVVVGLSTWFSDDSAVGTRFPYGAADVKPNLIRQVSQISLRHAYQIQQQAVSEHSKLHGEPLGASITDLQELERRINYGVTNYAADRAVVERKLAIVLDMAGLICGLIIVATGLGYIVTGPLTYYLPWAAVAVSLLMFAIRWRYLRGYLALQRRFRQMRRRTQN